MSDDLETLHGQPLSLKLAGDGAGIVEGLCAVYDVVDGHDEILAPFVFRKSLEETKALGHRLPCLWQHAQDSIIGSWFELREVPEGLLGKAQLNLDSPRGREAWSFITARHASGLSVGFCRAERRGRTIVSADLKEISVVSVPAADKARIKLKDCSTVPALVDALAAGQLGRRDLELISRKAWPALSGEEDPEELERLAERVRRATAALKGA